MSKADKRKRILKAAEMLFAERRFHEVTMDDVAKAAEVGKGTIYLHFSDKNELFRETVTSGWDELCDLLEARVPDDQPFSEQLRCVCAEISSFQERRRPLFRMMHSEEGRPWSGGKTKGQMKQRWIERRKRLASVVGNILGHGMASGELRDDFDAETLAAILLSLLRSRERLLAHASDASCELDSLLDLFLHGAGRADN